MNSFIHFKPYCGFLFENVCNLLFPRPCLFLRRRRPLLFSTVEMKGVLQQKASQRGKRKRKGTLKARAGKEGRGHLSGGEGGGEKATKKLLLLAGGLVAWKTLQNCCRNVAPKNINSKAQNFPRFGCIFYKFILSLSMVKALAHFCFLPGMFQGTSNMSPVWRQLSSLLFLLSSPPAMFQMALFPSPLFAPMDMMAWGGRRKKVSYTTSAMLSQGGKRGGEMFL